MTSLLSPSVPHPLVWLPALGGPCPRGWKCAWSWPFKDHSPLFVASSVVLMSSEPDLDSEKWPKLKWSNVDQYHVKSLLRYFSVSHCSLSSKWNPSDLCSCIVLIHMYFTLPVPKVVLDNFSLEGIIKCLSSLFFCIFQYEGDWFDQSVLCKLASFWFEKCWGHKMK